MRRVTRSDRLVSTEHVIRSTADCSHTLLACFLLLSRVEAGFMLLNTSSRHTHTHAQTHTYKKTQSHTDTHTYSHTHTHTLYLTLLPSRDATQSLSLTDVFSSYFQKINITTQPFLRSHAKATFFHYSPIA